MQPTNELQTHEWLTVILFCFLLVFVGVISYINEMPKPIEVNETVTIHVSGAIPQDRFVDVPFGTKIHELLSQLELDKEADPSSLKKNKKLTHNQTLIIPSKLIEITVIEEGKEPIILKIPKKTPLKDLQNYIQLSENTDFKKLQRKRHLKEGETVKVPQITR